jgi:hypothetical protein
VPSLWLSRRPVGVADFLMKRHPPSAVVRRTTEDPSARFATRRYANSSSRYRLSSASASTARWGAPTAPRLTTERATLREAAC